MEIVPPDAPRDGFALLALEAFKARSTLCVRVAFAGARLEVGCTVVVPARKPFWLSGGLSIESLKALGLIDHPGLIGIDVNSKFESHPGMKKIELLRALKKSL